jgi:hypothetical protein
MHGTEMFLSERERTTNRKTRLHHLKGAERRTTDGQPVIQRMIAHANANGVQISLPAGIAAHARIEFLLSNQAENSAWKSKKFLGRVC